MHRVIMTSVALMVWACSHSEPAQTYPPTPGMTPASAPASEMEAKKQSDVATQAQVSISDEIKKACGISDPDSYFAFDSAKLSSRDVSIGKQLADCFTTGPLKGKTMRLVGHTDPRGSEDYNMVLGEHRADNYKHFLSDEGLAADRMQTSSRGKLDAKGVDQATWALDRRVDVMLAQ